MVISQLIVNILVAYSLIFIVAAGFALIYHVSRFFHFAHGIVFTAGAYFAFLLNVWIGVLFFFQFFSPSC